MTREKILMIDAKWNNCEAMRHKLENRNFVFLQESDFERGLKRFEEETPALVIVNASSGNDINSFLSEIRKNSQIPVIVTSENSQPLDRITALEIGADDYVIIPYDIDELVARVRAILRRYNRDSFTKSNLEIIYPGLNINLTNYELILDGELVKIPPKELNLLYLLASNPNMVFSREQLMDRIWGFECYSDLRTVDVHVKRVRQKLEGHEKGWRLDTVRGVGYKFSTK